jgi:hypothetical protein
MSEENREIQELEKLKAIHLGQYQRLINEISVNMEQEDDALLQILRHQWGSAEELQYSFIASEFEREAGFPIIHLPVFLNGTYGLRERITYREGRLTARERVEYFQLRLANLADDNNAVDSFRSTFRIDKTTFEWLVAELMHSPELQFTANNATPVEVQVGATLMRLANHHYGYRLIKNDWQISYGSYTNFTRRVTKAIRTKLTSTLLRWPDTRDLALETARGFAMASTSQIDSAFQTSLVRLMERTALLESHHHLF